MDLAEKLLGLDLISKKYAGYAPAEYTQAALADIQIIKIVISPDDRKIIAHLEYPIRDLIGNTAKMLHLPFIAPLGTSADR